MPQKKRCQEIARFSHDPEVNVILCSVKAAGVGITLTVANHVFLADLWWSPAVDFQAIDRVHRLGQTKPVSVLRFLVKDSIDEKIYALQKEKNVMAKLTFERQTEEARGQRARDIQGLLS